jgi:hypothetical protein
VFNRDDGGWEIFGGTSVAAPIVASFYALAENAHSTDDLAGYPYAHAASLNDITAGSNGDCGTYLCNGATGYDGPTGVGTPNSPAAFAASGIAPTPPPPLPPQPNPDFSLHATKPAGPLRPGTTAKTTVTLAPLNGFTGPVDLATWVSPHDGLSASIRSAPLSVGSSPTTTALTLRAYTGGTYKVTVFGSQGDLEHKQSFTIAVNDFSMRVTPTRASVLRGKPAHFTVTFKSMGALKGPIKLTAAGRLAKAVRFTRNPAPASGPVAIIVATSTNDAPGLVPLRFTGVSGAVKHSVVVTLLLQ